jgi:cytochrome c-type biogenesis protein CcmH
MQIIVGVGMVGDHPADASATNETNSPASVAADSSEPKTAEPTANREPRPEDIRNAEKMAPSDRLAMIQRMVDSLAERLEQSPHDADGWIKLIRSWSVLGDKDKAKQALDKALKIFTEETPEGKRIKTTAEEFGLGQ